MSNIFENTQTFENAISQITQTIDNEKFELIDVVKIFNLENIVINDKLTQIERRRNKLFKKHKFQTISTIIRRLKNNSNETINSTENKISKKK